MNDLPDPQDETDRPGQEPAVTPEPEDYTPERVQEFLAEDAMPAGHDHYGRARSKQRREPGRCTRKTGTRWNTTPEFWLNLQAQHDLEVARERIRHELDAITPRSGGA